MILGTGGTGPLIKWHTQHFLRRAKLYATEAIKAELCDGCVLSFVRSFVVPFCVLSVRITHERVYRHRPNIVAMEKR